MLKFRLALISSPNWYAVNDINSLCIYIEKITVTNLKVIKLGNTFELKISTDSCLK